MTEREQFATLHDGLIRRLRQESACAAAALGGQHYTDELATVVSGILDLAKLCGEAADALASLTPSATPRIEDFSEEAADELVAEIHAVGSIARAIGNASPEAGLSRHDKRGEDMVLIGEVHKAVEDHYFGGLSAGESLERIRALLVPSSTASNTALASTAENILAAIDEEGPREGKISLDVNTVKALCSVAVAPSATASAQINPSVLPALPGQKALTVVMLKDDGDVQADAAIAAMQRGDTFLLPQGVSELFFHQLRLRIALDPSLADKIAVYYLLPGERRYQEANPADPCFKWPVGFCMDLWEKEMQISAVNGIAKGVAGDKAREVEAELRAKYSSPNDISRQQQETP